MIKFFRKIRYDLVGKNKTSKYIKYALGEIVLVVVGILIALQLNNWKENRILNSRKFEYFNSLIADLKADSVLINRQNHFMILDLAKLVEYKDRLSHHNASMDTLKKIVKYEYLSWFDPSNNLNLNTYTALISSGDLNIFDLEFRYLLLNHHRVQNRTIKIVNDNMDLFMDRLARFDLPLTQSEVLSEYNVTGQFNENIWRTTDDDELTEKFLNRLFVKSIMERNILFEREMLLDSTYSYLRKLYSYKLK